MSRRLSLFTSHITSVAALLATSLLLSTTTPADAFCGFYVGGADAKLFNDATVVVMMREGTRTVLAMQNAYKGPPEKFAMVVPVPVVLQQENVKTLKRELFDHVDQLASPRLVEYWEQDPCYVPPRIQPRPPSPVAAAAPPTIAKSAPRDLGVRIEAQFTVGEYQVVVLSAQDSGGLDTWLHREGYNIPKGGEPYFRPYVASGSKFFVAKVDITKVKMEDGVAALSPLRFHYDSTDFKLPVRLGLINSSGTQDLIVHILGRGTRYDVANYPNVTIPTNLDVSEAASASFGTFYTTLFDRTLEKNPKAVVTEYAWEPTNCDPCPGPPLDLNDINTLGGDVLPSSRAPEQFDDDDVGLGPGRGTNPNLSDCNPPFWFDASGVKHYKPSCLNKRIPIAFPFGQAKPAAKTTAGRPRVFDPTGGGGQMVLTRLHVRYTKESLGDDLSFRAVKAITGGREVTGSDGALEHGAQPSSANNFQARYAIRHSWTGPIECKNPRRGVWGANPRGSSGGGSEIKAAKKLGLTPRSNADLGTFVKSTIPEIGFAPNGMAVDVVPVPPPPSATAANPPTTPSASPGDVEGTKKKGCLGCSAIAKDERAATTTMMGALFAFAGVVVVGLRRRARRR